MLMATKFCPNQVKNTLGAKLFVKLFVVEALKKYTRFATHANQNATKSTPTSFNGQWSQVESFP
jgi:hypothetical protein